MKDNAFQICNESQVQTRFKAFEPNILHKYLCASQIAVYVAYPVGISTNVFFK